MVKISIVIPTLNEEKYLPKLLSCIKEQTFSDYEVIVADANSKDKTREIAKSFGAVVVDGGMPGVGRNRGGEVAKGEMLFFLDADVTFNKKFLNSCLKEIKVRKLKIVSSGYYTDSPLIIDKVLFFIGTIYVRFFQFFCPKGPGSCIIISKKRFEEIGGFNEEIIVGEDYDFISRCAKKGKFRILKTVRPIIPMRRFDKEGRFNLIAKYFYSEFQILFFGKVRKGTIDYEFGNYDDILEKNKINK